MPMHKKPQAGLQGIRTFAAQIRAPEDENSRTIELSFSSEMPYERWFGPEILSHDEGAVDLTRLQEVGVVLFSHGRDPNFGKMPIAKIEKAWIDTQERKGKALITFDDDEDSEKVFQKVKKGLIKGVSVGYTVSSWEEVAAGKTSANGRFTGPAYIAIKWEPYEISIEPTPADPSVGVGRDINQDEILNKEVNNMGEKEKQNVLQDKQNVKTVETVTITPGNDIDLKPDSIKEEAIKAERQRVVEITAMCRDFDVDPREYIEKGFTVDQVRAALLEVAKQRMKPLVSGADVRVERDEADKFRAAASDAILMRAGRMVEKPAEGARELRGMRLRDLAVECLIRAGYSNAHRMSDDELFRAALTPDSQFASILSDAVNKTMATAYRAARTTYQVWTGRGSNPDFKAAVHYQISEAGDLLPMTQTGEFKFDEMTDQGVTKAVATFGREWGITRQALINDDLGVLTRIPEAYVRAASRGINKLVYKMLGTNPVIYDGKQLFHADHRNLGTPGPLSTTTLSEARAAMRKQKNLRGKETLNISPAFLIVPAALETEAEKILMSISDPASNNAGVANVFRNSLTLVVDAELDDYSEKAYYLAASPADIDTIEVTYLNGDDMPKLESQVGFDFLGIKWRIYIDYGVTVLDYRGLFKNAGE